MFINQVFRCVIKEESVGITNMGRGRKQRVYASDIAEIIQKKRRESLASVSSKGATNICDTLMGCKYVLFAVPLR